MYTIDVASMNSAFAKWSVERELSVLMLDIDNFKEINDTYGHLTGDRVLTSLASFLRRELRQIDLLGRYGGDEFIALLPETDLVSAKQVGERLRMNITKTVLVSDPNPIQITISVGVATLGDQNDDLKKLIQRADQALYHAKESGRNQVEIHHSSQ